MQRLVALKSDSIVSLLTGSCTGVYLRRNLRLRMVTRLDPSTHTAYWSYCLTSMTTPVLSHLRGWAPV